jgi:hypothetical protein
VNPTVIAAGWAIGWLALLLAAADWPPPIGFLWLLPMVATGAVVVWWRAGVYATAAADGPGRCWAAAARDGALAGAIVGLVILALPGVAGRATELAFTDWIVFFSVLGAVGALNGLGVRALVGINPRRRD